MEIEKKIEAFVKGITRGPYYAHGKESEGEGWGETSSKDVVQAASSESSKDRDWGEASSKDAAPAASSELSDIFRCAVEQAYLDASRVITGVGKDAEKQKQKNKAIDSYTEKVKKYFEERNPPSSQGEFDDWHSDTMSAMRQEADFLTIGLAQKIVNMAFKYLYCCSDFRTNYPDRFTYCHMALDGFTLAWAYRVGCCEKDETWSKIDDLDAYKSIQKGIRGVIEMDESYQTVLEAEFDIWQGEKELASVKDMLTSLKTVRDSALVIDGVSGESSLGMLNELLGKLEEPLNERKSALEGWLRDFPKATSSS